MPKQRTSSRTTSNKASPYDRPAKTPAELTSSEDQTSPDDDALTLQSLSDNFTNHRTEVMEILFNLTKALQDERKFREALLKRVEAVEAKQVAQGKTLKDQDEKICGHELDFDRMRGEFVNQESHDDDIIDATAEMDYKLTEEVGEILTRLDHVESGLRKLKQAKNAAAPSTVAPALSSPERDHDAWDGEDVDVEMFMTGSSSHPQPAKRPAV